jgi:hypothetical protein
LHSSLASYLGKKVLGTKVYSSTLGNARLRCETVFFRVYFLGQTAMLDFYYSIIGPTYLIVSRRLVSPLCVLSYEHFLLEASSLLVSPPAVVYLLLKTGLWNVEIVWAFEGD